jgi:hypothetical protein
LAQLVKCFLQWPAQQQQHLSQLTIALANSSG